MNTPTPPPPEPTPGRRDPGREETRASESPFVAQPPKPRRWLRAIGLGVAFLLTFFLGMVAAQDGVPETTTTAGDEQPTITESPDAAPEDSPEPPPPPPPAAPDPAGETSGYCDYLLDFDNGHSFVATVDVTNTGNVGITINVWVEFSQIGADPVRFLQPVDVPVGETVAVNFDEAATHDNIERHQSSDSQCDIGGDIVTTFGEVVES